MRFGTFLHGLQYPGADHGEALRGLVEAAVASEAAGFDEVWLAEHHFIPLGVCPQAATLAGHLLGRTTRISVGTAVSVLSSQHPVALAEQAALLDQVSGGRFALGVGRGGPWVDLEVFGTGLPRFERGFAEALDLLVRWLTSERVAADGEFFRFREVRVVPQPATRPHPPIRVACTSAATLDIAAARGLPVLLGMELDDRQRRELLDRYTATAQRHGHDGAADHAAVVLGFVARSRAEAEQVLRPALLEWLERGVGAYVSLVPRSAGRDLAAYVDRLLALSPIGSEGECCERLAEIAAGTGLDHVLLFPEGAGSREATLDNLAHLANAVSGMG